MKMDNRIGIVFLALLFCCSVVWGQEKVGNDEAEPLAAAGGANAQQDTLAGRTNPVPMPNALPRALVVRTDHKMKWKRVDGRACAPMPNVLKADTLYPLRHVRVFPADSLAQDSLNRERK